MAAPADRGGRPGGRPGVLETGPGRCPAGAGDPCRPSSPGRAGDTGRVAPVPAVRPGRRRPAYPGPQRERHPVHDAARGLPGAAAPLQRQRRHRRRRPGGQPGPARDRAAHRVLREYARAAHRPVGQPVLPRAASPGPAGVPGRLRTSGTAVRAAGGGFASAPGPVTLARLPGLIRLPEHLPAGFRRRRTAS